jgi:hypothetical protein
MIVKDLAATIKDNDDDDDYTGCCERNAGFEVEPVRLT